MVLWLESAARAKGAYIVTLPKLRENLGAVTERNINTHSINSSVLMLQGLLMLRVFAKSFGGARLSDGARSFDGARTSDAGLLVVRSLLMK